MQLHQLSMAYVAEQDRILARVNTQDGQELQFWLTRRLALGLTPVLDKVASEHSARMGAAGITPAQVATMDPVSRKTVAEFQRSETLKGADFSTPYQPAPKPLPRFEHPLLVTEVQLSPLANGQVRIRCVEKLPGAEDAQRRQFQLNLSQQLLHAFVHLLERAVRHSLWRDPTSVASDVLAMPEPPAGPPRATYLN